MTTAPLAPVSDLDRAIAAHRAALLRQDAATLSIVERRWRAVQRRLQGDIDALLRSIDADTTPNKLRRLQRYRDLLAQVETQVQSYADSLAPTITAGQQAAVTMAAAHARAQVLAQLGDSATWNTLPVAATQATVGLLSDGSPVREALDKLAPLTSELIQNELISGVARGIGTRVIAQNIRKMSGIPLVRALTISRSSVMHSYRIATIETYRANSDVVTSWIWSAAKSSRTCLNCLSRDGSEWPLDTFMPAHLNCRCSLRPKTRSYKSLGINAPEPDITIETGTEWFERQDDTTKQKMMGPTAFRLYKQGRIQLSDFEGSRHSQRWGAQTYQRPLKEIVG